LVHWPLIDGLLHLIQRGGPAQSSPRCTKCNGLSINGQCTDFIYYSMWRCNYHCTVKGKTKTDLKTKLEGHSVERMYLRQRCFDDSLAQLNHFKTTPRCSGQFRVAALKRTISEKAIRFRHPEYNPDRAQKLISSSMSRHLSTCNISSKSMHAFLSNLANRQTNEHGQKHIPPHLSEVEAHL